MLTFILSKSFIDSNEKTNHHQDYQLHPRLISQSFISIYEENTFPNYIIVMPRSQNLQSRDLPIRLFIFILIQFIKLRSSMHLIKPLPNKHYCLIVSLQKHYQQINAFLATSGRVEKNLEALLTKTTRDLGSRTRGGILSYINECLGRSHNVVVRDEIAWTQPA